MMETLVEFVIRSPYVLAVTAILVLASLSIWLGIRFDKQQQRKSTLGIKDEVKCRNS